MHPVEYYESIGDKLAAEGRSEEALRAYRHAQNGTSDLDNYKRLHVKIMSILDPTSEPEPGDFNALCKSTGMKKKELAEICGKSAVQFSKYCNGISPVPRLVWDKVSEFRKK